MWPFNRQPKSLPEADAAEAPGKPEPGHPAQGVPTPAGPVSDFDDVEDCCGTASEGLPPHAGEPEAGAPQDAVDARDYLDSLLDDGPEFIEWDADPSGIPVLTGASLLSGFDKGTRQAVAHFLAGLAFEADASGAVISPAALSRVARDIAEGSDEGVWPLCHWFTDVKLADDDLPGLVSALAAATTSLSPGALAPEMDKELIRCDLGAVLAACRAASGISPRPGRQALVKSWAYVAACLGDRPSMLKIAGALDLAADNPCIPLDESWREMGRAAAWGWRTLAAASDPVWNDHVGTDAAREIASARLDLGDPPSWSAEISLSPPPGLSLSPRPAGEWTVRPGGKPPHAPPPAGCPAKVVLDGIGDEDSDEGRSAARRFGRLLQPLPLLGGGLDPDAVWAALRGEFPWMAEANREVALSAAMSRRSGRKWFSARPILLVGPAGVGKTRWARRVAEICGLKMARLSFAGLSTAMAVNGGERGWRGASPCFLAAAMNTTGTANPLALLDEVDKVSEGRHNGNALDALLPWLEPETARRHHDTYLHGHLDLSSVVFVMTANSLAGLPDPLLSRVSIVHSGKPSASDFQKIMRGIQADVAADYQMPEGEVPDLSEALPGLEAKFLENLSIRRLKAAVETEIKTRVWSPPGPKLVAADPPS